MDYVYAVVRNQGPSDIDAVYTNKDTAKAVYHRMNNAHWEMMNTPIKYRRKNYEPYSLITIQVDSGEPI